MIRYLQGRVEFLSLRRYFLAVAWAAGTAPGSTDYDCRRLFVSADINRAFCEHMKRTEMEEAIGAVWMIYGPKVSEGLIGSSFFTLDCFFELRNAARKALGMPKRNAPKAL